LRRSVEESVPPGTEELNLGAFQRGYDFGRELIAKSPRPAAARA